MDGMLNPFGFWGPWIGKEPYGTPIKVPRS